MREHRPEADPDRLVGDLPDGRDDEWRVERVRELDRLRGCVSSRRRAIGRQENRFHRRSPFVQGRKTIRAGTSPRSTSSIASWTSASGRSSGRSRREQEFGAALGAAAVVATSVVSAGSRPAARPAVEARSFLSGIAQHGIVLGSPRAAVTLVEFADLQCPCCGQFARDAMPTIVRDYVRTGKVRIVFQGLAFLGVDSDTALRAVLAAARQNHGWDVLDGLFQRQGGENTGWVTDALVREVAAGVRGLDLGRMQGDAAGVDAAIAAARRSAEQAHVESTPSFLVGRTGRPLRRLAMAELSADAVRPALDELLAG
jgi:protein-disulfide isomerase